MIESVCLGFVRLFPNGKGVSKGGGSYWCQSPFMETLQAILTSASPNFSREMVTAIIFFVSYGKIRVCVCTGSLPRDLVLMSIICMTGHSTSVQTGHSTS